MVQVEMALTSITKADFHGELTLWKLAGYQYLLHSRNEYWQRHVWIGENGLVVAVRDQRTDIGEEYFYRPTWPISWVPEVVHLDPP